MPTYSPDRHPTPQEAQLQRLYALRHDVHNIAASGFTITPSTGRKIVVEALDVQTDSTAAMTLALSCPGVDTMTFRIAIAGSVTRSGGVFVGAPDQVVTITPAGYTAGTYAEARIVFYEI